MDRYIFCDEFGNSGARLFETTQPVLVYAFTLIAPEDLSRAAAQVQALYERERLTVTELKSSTLQGSSRGRARYARIGRIASDCGIQVCLSVVEKRYQACVMIVESYLDPEIYERVPRELYDPQLRQRFADACYDYLDDTRLIEFLNCVQVDDPNEIAKVGERISRTLRFHPDDFVSSVAGMMETRPDHVFRYRQKLPDLPKNSNVPAAQFAGFYPGLERVDARLEHLDAMGDLIRDEDLQFGEVLDLAFFHSRSSEGEAYSRRLPLTRIRSCRGASSTSEFGIQLADLVAGLFGRIVAQVVQRRAPTAALAQMVDSWRPVLASPNEHYWMLADAVLSQTVREILGADIAP